MKRTLILGCAALLLPLSSLSAQTAEQEPTPLGVETSIVFPDNSSIRNWQADGNRGIWVQDRQRNWYYGSFAGFCSNLNFAQAIGVETRGVNRLDRFSTIIVRGESCPLSSFVTSTPPPTKEERKAAKAKKKADAAKASNPD